MRNPFIELVGAELVEQSPGHCVWKLEMRDCHGNPQGGLHGGVISTLLDVACAYSGAFPEEGEPEQRPATLSLTLQFLAKASGRIFLAKGRRTGGGRRIFFADAQLFSDDGTLVATASGSFCLQRRHASQQVSEPARESELSDMHE